MIALAAPRFKWPHLTSSRLISPRLAWPGRGLCYVSTRQQLKMLLDWHCNGKRAEGGLGQWTCHTLMLDIDANLKVTCIIGCFVWFFGYFLLRMGCKCNRLMRSGRFLFSLLLLLLLLFGTPQVHSGSMGLWVNSTSKANWPGVTSCLPLAWTRKSLCSLGSLSRMHLK